MQIQSDIEEMRKHMSIEEKDNEPNVTIMAHIPANTKLTWSALGKISEAYLRKKEMLTMAETRKIINTQE